MKRNVSLIRIKIVCNLKMSYNWGILSKKTFLWMDGWSGRVVGLMDGWMDGRMEGRELVKPGSKYFLSAPKIVSKILIFLFLTSFYLLCELHPHKQQ